jgi:hypothetical protein
MDSNQPLMRPIAAARAAAARSDDDGDVGGESEAPAAETLELRECARSVVATGPACRRGGMGSVQPPHLAHHPLVWWGRA